MKKVLISILCLFAVFACTPQKPIDNGKSDIENPDPNPDPEPEPNPEPEPEPNPEPNPDPNPEDPISIEVLDPGSEREDFKPTPQHPDAIHEVEYKDFYNVVYDQLDEFGNIDYVISQGNGVSWPIITEEGYIRFYQGTSEKKGGSYIRIRSHNNAKIQEVEVGSSGKTKLAYSINGKAAKSQTIEVQSGSTLTIDEGEVDQICIYCMGTSQSERWEMNYIRVKYRGGYIKEDYYQEPKEYGPLVRVTLPFTENFETGFSTTDKPSYYKYGITSGRDNLQWSTWYGSFSWQNPIEGGQSAQLRVYKEEEDYEKEQFGHLKMEFFLANISEVDFQYYMTEFWMKATISWCEFGKSDWNAPEQIALKEYSQRETIQNFHYVLDNGTAHNAKIKIELDSATGFPTKGHYDFIVDNFTFR